jgi:hypothetical protein
MRSVISGAHNKSVISAYLRNQHGPDIRACIIRPRSWADNACANESSRVSRGATTGSRDCGTGQCCCALRCYKSLETLRLYEFESVSSLCCLKGQAIIHSLCVLTARVLSCHDESCGYEGPQCWEANREAHPTHTHTHTHTHHMYLHCSSRRLTTMSTPSSPDFFMQATDNQSHDSNETSAVSEEILPLWMPVDPSLLQERAKGAVPASAAGMPVTNRVHTARKHAHDLTGHAEEA